MAGSISLFTDVPVAFDSTDHTHIGVSFMLLRLVDRGLPSRH